MTGPIRTAAQREVHAPPEETIEDRLRCWSQGTGNNGSIIRAFPDAAPGDPRARMLLFSNTADQHLRRNLTVRLSCDNGATWPVSRVVQSGASAYSTLTPLIGDDGKLGGRYGLLYERDGYRHISFTSFGLDWLGGGCETSPPVLDPNAMAIHYLPVHSPLQPSQRHVTL